jgi:hypothetical protein
MCKSTDLIRLRALEFYRASARRVRLRALEFYRASARRVRLRALEFYLRFARRASTGRRRRTQPLTS